MHVKVLAEKIKKSMPAVCLKIHKRKIEYLKEEFIIG